MCGQFARSPKAKTDTNGGCLWMSRSNIKIRRCIHMRRSRASIKGEICEVQNTQNYWQWQLQNVIWDRGNGGAHCYFIPEVCKLWLDNAVRIIALELCGKYSLNRANNLKEQLPDGITKTEKCKILSHAMFHCVHSIRHRKLTIVVVNRK